MLRRRWHARLDVATVEFCDRCATICTDACRALALREQSLQTALRFGPRV